MPTTAALLLTAATGSAALSVGVAAVGTRAPSLLLRSASATRRVPRRARPTRIRAAAAIGGEFGGLAQRRALAGEFIERLRNVLPGGSWWRLEDGEEAGGGRAEASGATAASALRRMWALVASDRWVVFVGFASLIGAALAEIAIPHLLAASIFSAQNGGAVFYRNAKLLVKRMREMLFDSILSQDIAFFDEETVGDLTSRLGSDCQQVSRVIGNDLNLISRNLLQKRAAKFAQEFTASANNVIAVLIGGISIMAGKLTAEQLTKFILYAEWLILSTWWIGDNWSSLMQSVGASEKVFRLMDLLPSRQLSHRLQKLEGRIQYADVSFSYPSRPTVPILGGLNLTLHPNEVVAIVGLSGSGKSTVVNLLLRLYEPTDGQILVDGVPLSELDIRWFRERIGFVGQEPRLFRMDISSNIRYGCPREVSNEEVEWAAKQAYAHDFIMSLPDGYNTIVDDALLSGGQKQRVAIARALLRDPSILVLDEATSALDAESEHYVKNVITKFSTDPKARRTVIIIAHRLSTIQAADRIIVMENGNIVEDGKHSELINKHNGLYSRLARRQNDALD
uniref:ABC transporter domain-containing protein n=1 Tax=Oryza meridionalis TaxID=40149 RepID=A0A0E0CBZ9_9ORYZ